MTQSDKSNACRTRAEVLEMFENEGLTISDWARVNGFAANVVYTLLSGRTLGRRGKAHKAAVALGLKPQPGMSGGLLNGPLTNSQRSNS